jgi:hypothetical protein
VGVDVVDVGRGEAGKLDRPRYRVAGLFTVGVRRHDLVADCSTNSSSSLRIPVCPSSSFFQVSSTFVASAVVIATPVTTHRVNRSRSKTPP